MAPENDRRLSDRSPRRHFLGLIGGAAAGFSGCSQLAPDDRTDRPGDGGGVTPAADPTVTLEWAVGPTIKANEQAFVDALRDAGLPESISFRFRPGASGTDFRNSTYRLWLEQEQPRPTLLKVDTGWAMPFMANGKLENLSAVLPGSVRSRIRDSYLSEFVRTATYEGDLYAVPLNLSVGVIFYRRDLATDAGLDPAGEDWATTPLTWKRFGTVAKRLQDRPGVEFGFTTQAADYEGLACCTFREVLESFGGSYFGATSNRFGPVGDRPVTVDDDAFRTAIRFLRTAIHGSNQEETLSGYTGGYAPQRVLDWKEQVSLDQFLAGRSAMHRHWITRLPRVAAADAFGDDLGVMPLPYGRSTAEAAYEGTGGSTSAIGGWGVAINPFASRERRAAAARVLEVLTRDDFLLAMHDHFGWQPPKQHLARPVLDAAGLSRYLPAYMRALESGTTRPVTTVWPAESATISTHVHDALTGRRSVEAVTADLQDRLERIEAAGRSGGG